MSTLKPFTLRVSDDDMADLRARLGRTRFPDQAPDRPWAYGADLGYLRDPCRIGAIASTGVRKKRSSMDFPSS
jgi:hypothetical protein